VPGGYPHDGRPEQSILAERRHLRAIASSPAKRAEVSLVRFAVGGIYTVSVSASKRKNALIGQLVAGRFTVKRFLGEGGMATVYVAEQAEEPREVALKIMNADLTNDRTFVRRFQREAKASSRVKHPCSVQIIDYGVADGLSYIAMELLVGADLYVLLEREGSLSQARAVRILIEVCDALMVAHELGIVHRDLKPENIMMIVDPAHPNGERVKVLDFGIAKLLAADAIAEEAGEGRDPRLDPASAVTRAGTFIGTPAYMSPEQCALLPVDTRADIYTCGVLLYQLVTGQLPFEGQTPLHTATLHIHQAAPSPMSVSPGLDPRLDAVIMKALSKRPAERHQTARHLGATLRKLLPDLADAQVGLRKGDAGGAGSSERPTAVTMEAPPPKAPYRAPFAGAFPAAKTPIGAPDSDDMADSSDNQRTLVHTSTSNPGFPAQGYAAPAPAPTFGPPPEAPTFDAAPRARAPVSAFARTEKSISSDLIPQARGHVPAPVDVVAPAPLPPGAYTPMPAPAPWEAPRPPVRVASSAASGARSLVLGLVIGVTIVAVLFVVYLLLPHR
jgi:serine/threonine-protein kinase